MLGLCLAAFGGNKKVIGAAGHSGVLGPFPVTFKEAILAFDAFGRFNKGKTQFHPFHVHALYTLPVNGFLVPAYIYAMNCIAGGDLNTKSLVSDKMSPAFEPPFIDAE